MYHSKFIPLGTSKFSFLLFGLFIFLLGSFAIPNLKKRITDTEYRYEFYTTQKEVSSKQDRLYYWFKGGAIHSSEYGVSGELLDGEFEKFYLSNQLAEKGVFKKGLKDGLWKTWHKNGMISTEIYFSSGQKNGTFYGYDENGKLTEKGKFKKNKKHGKWINFTQKDTVEYRKGEVFVKVPEKPYMPQTREQWKKEREERITARKAKRDAKKKAKEQKEKEKEKEKKNIIDEKSKKPNQKKDKPITSKGEAKAEKKKSNSTNDKSQ